MIDSQIVTAKMEVTVTGEFYDFEASEETLRSCVEQDLSELYSDVDVKLLKTRSPWISVKDRLPEIRKAVLAYAPFYKNIWAVTLHEDGNWYFWSPHPKLYDPDWESPITHWMPLPEPPEGVK